MKPEKEYIIFCDESDSKGEIYSHFYGGIIVRGSQLQRIETDIVSYINELGIKEEVKWNKVNQLYLDSYKKLITRFFSEVSSGNIKIRIMFQENRFRPTYLTKEQRESGYFLLYYQFIKHAFGLDQLVTSPEAVQLRLYFDQFPDTNEKASIFRSYLLSLFKENKHYREGNLRVTEDNIVEVHSHNHVLLQLLDVVLGAMCFRLNHKHLHKPSGQTRRGKRTICKEKLYKHILAEIKKFRPNFNIGISTGMSNRAEDRWEKPYLHWSFKPKYNEVNKKPPLGPT